MIGLTSHHTYYLYSGVCDMRKGFDGLSGLISVYSWTFDPLVPAS